MSNVKGRVNSVYDKASNPVQVFGGKGLKIPSGEFTPTQDIVVCSNSETVYITDLFDIEGADLSETTTVTKDANVPFSFKSGVTYTLSADFIGERM